MQLPAARDRQPYVRVFAWALVLRHQHRPKLQPLTMAASARAELAVDAAGASAAMAATAAHGKSKGVGHGAHTAPRQLSINTGPGSEAESARAAGASPAAVLSDALLSPCGAAAAGAHEQEQLPPRVAAGDLTEASRSRRQPRVSAALYGGLWNVDPGAAYMAALRSKEAAYALASAIVSATMPFSGAARLRAILLDWLMEVSQEYCLKRATYYTAVALIDKFLSMVSPWLLFFTVAASWSDALRCSFSSGVQSSAFYNARNGHVVDGAHCASTRVPRLCAELALRAVALSMRRSGGFVSRRESRGNLPTSARGPDSRCLGPGDGRGGARDGALRAWSCRLAAATTDTVPLDCRSAAASRSAGSSCARDAAPRSCSAQTSRA